MHLAFVQAFALNSTLKSQAASPLLVYRTFGYEEDEATARKAPAAAEVIHPAHLDHVHSLTHSLSEHDMPALAKLLSNTQRIPGSSWRVGQERTFYFQRRCPDHFSSSEEGR